jgi:hypothetical protein
MHVIIDRLHAGWNLPDWLIPPHADIAVPPECRANILGQAIPITHLALWKETGPMAVRGGPEFRGWGAIAQSVDRNRRFYQPGTSYAMRENKEDYLWVALTPAEEAEVLRAFVAFKKLHMSAVIESCERHIEELKEKL